MSEEFARQWAMLKMIPRHPRSIDSVTIRERLEGEGLGEISLRTIQRNLEKLSQSFPLGVVNPKERPIQWHWTKRAAPFAIPGLDPTEAVTMKLVETYLRPLLPGAMLDALAPHFESANKLLKSKGGLGPARWTNLIRALPKGIQLLPPKIDPQAQRTVYDALLREKQLELDYRPRKPKGNIPYQINPLGLVVRDGVIYLVASLVENEAIRQFVLHRIKSAQVLDEPAISPRGFDLDEYIAKGGFGWPTGGKIRLVAIFDDGPAQTLAETPVSPDQTMTELDGKRFKLTATVQETKELHWWLLSFGPEVEVVEPKSLRAQMRKLVEISAKRYRIKR
jgi:hypothetical protein